jgi:type IV secretory pathway protease TraF
VQINGVERAQISPAIYTAFDKRKQEFDADYRLAADEYFVLGISPRSFDSRYWGPIKRSWITARLIGII